MAYKFGEAFIDLTGKNVGLDKMLSRVRKSFNSLKVHLKRLAIVGIGAFTVGLAYATKQAMDFDTAVAQLRAILNSTGESAGYSLKQMLKLADTFQEVTTHSNTAVIGMQSILATFMKVKGKVFDDGLEAAMNMSRVFKQDLRQSIIQVGFALNSPVEGMSRLRRVGVSFTESQKNTIKSFMEQNRIMDAQRVILKELQNEVGNVERAYAKTIHGSLAQMKNAFDDIARKIGKAVLPGLQDMATNIKKWMEENETVVVAWGHKTIAVVELIKDGFFILIEGLRKNWKEALKGMSKAFIEATIGLIRIARVAGAAIGEKQGKSFLGEIMKYLARSGYAYEKLAAYLSQLWMSEKTYQSSMKYWDNQEEKAVAFWQKYSNSATKSLESVRTELEMISGEVTKKMQDALPTNMVDKFTAAWDKLLKKLERIRYESKHMKWIEFLGKATSELDKWINSRQIAQQEWGRKPSNITEAGKMVTKRETTFQPAALVGLKGMWDKMAQQTAGVMKELEVQQAQLHVLQNIHAAVKESTQTEKTGMQNLKESLDKPRIGVVGP